ncbi:MAG: PhzF family phenazine biosynthesis protein [Vibrio litoralis]|uniref:PhzF family phenazine biosynthesis protein n=1 Tax=Vibrio litoralis TaxID=335972 RepID=UPI003F9BE1EB
MVLDIFVVDAFTRHQFKGNSAAVIPIDDWLEPSLMQNIAAENNLSETAFIKKQAENCYEIRWFSPLTEIDFCGHATLASAHIIFNHLAVQGEIEFITQEVGSLWVNQLTDGRVEMSFPNQEPEVVDDIPSELLEGLSFQPVQVLKNRQAYFAVMQSEEDVHNVEYQSELLKQLAPLDVVVTSPSFHTDSKTEYDFISRYFWPANGGDEDPVTGSIHSGLAPYWAKQFDKSELVAYQASSRGGILYCHVKEERVLVSGYGTLYLQGQVFV